MYSQRWIEKLMYVTNVRILSKYAKLFRGKKRRNARIHSEIHSGFMTPMVDSFPSLGEIIPFVNISDFSLSGGIHPPIRKITMLRRIRLLRLSPEA